MEKSKKEREKKLIEMYLEDKMSCQEIANEYGITKQRVAVILKMAGVKLRPLGATRRIPVDNEALRCIDVPPNSDCWVWTGLLSSKGLPTMRWHGKIKNPKAFFYQRQYKESVPFGAIIENTCGNRLCCNPDHFEVTERPTYEHRRGIHSYSKLNWQLAEEIRQKYKKGNISQVDLAIEYEVSPLTIFKVVNNQSWVKK